MTTIDKTEIEKFSKLASDWWNPDGKFKPLHLFNPVRIKFIKEKLISCFDLDYCLALRISHSRIVIRNVGRRYSSIYADDIRIS